MNKLSIIFLMLSLLFIGCAKINEGYVINKEYVSGYDYIYQMPVNNGNNNTTFIPMLMHEPEKYKVEVRNNKNEKGILYLNKNAFDTLKLNDYVNLKGESK